MLSREKHLIFCKERALKYVDQGELNSAFSSMIGDLDSHPETRDHPANKIGMILFISGDLRTKDSMKKFIEGYN